MMSETSSEVRAALDGVFASTKPGEQLNWRDCAKAGWWSMELPEALGGGGANLGDVAHVLEVIGMHALRGPVLGSMLGVGGLLGLVDDSAMTRQLAQWLIDGSKIAVLAIEGDTPAAFSLDARGRVNGTARVVVDVESADVFVVPAIDHTGSLVFATIDVQAVAVEPCDLIDATRSIGRVRIENVAVGSDAVLIAGLNPSRTQQILGSRAVFGTAVDALGVAQAMLDATVAYVSEREQFGRPIGSFQAVQHACADMAVAITLGRALLSESLDCYESLDDRPDAHESFGVAVARLKAHVGDAAVAVAGKAMQLHGGYGYAWESNVHLFLKRAMVDRALHGDATAHRRVLATRFTRQSPMPH